MIVLNKSYEIPSTDKKNPKPGPKRIKNHINIIVYFIGINKYTVFLHTLFSKLIERLCSALSMSFLNNNLSPLILNIRALPIAFGFTYLPYKTVVTRY